MCYDQFLPYSWAKVTIMGATFHVKPFRNIPHFPADIPLKITRFRDLVFDISHMYYFSSGHCFSEALEHLQSPNLHTKTSLNDVSGLKSGFGFLYFCHSSAGQHGTWQQPPTLRKYGPCASTAMWVTVRLSGLFFPLWNVFSYLFLKAQHFNFN